MMALKLKVFRIEVEEDGMVGVLLFNGRMTGIYTMERDPNDPEFKPIPDGVYPLEPHTGYKYKGTLKAMVPGHTFVLFHNANLESHSEMCVILGLTLGWLGGKRAVLRSRDAMTKFKTHIVPKIKAGDTVQFITIGGGRSFDPINTYQEG